MNQSIANGLRDRTASSRAERRVRPYPTRRPVCPTNKNDPVQPLEVPIQPEPDAGNHELKLLIGLLILRAVFGIIIHLKLHWNLLA
ncbi:hypothetical protein E1B28_009805 [Marasmius oreades]|uniref:Uncharacterized protein n=1 Tax=Marasmius oreades TaxID=181124 RepID=A0A9P7RWZ0_9AGAR|nr:uncharacterized protein E1B28_009805 [Marasmius oreades]KAG7090711.1 hypothetical protein E1B28_009805 [Marasmius oreades]